MTNKQIIIDGIDVSKCFYLGYKKECGLKIYSGPRDSFESYEDYEAYCSKKMFKCNAKCPYAGFQRVKNKEKKFDEYVKKIEQQLKRKEQECEELKEKLRTKARGWANVNDQILKELAKIKENVEQGVKIHDDIIVSKQILQKINEVVDGKNS